MRQRDQHQILVLNQGSLNQEIFYIQRVEKKEKKKAQKTEDAERYTIWASLVHNTKAPMRMPQMQSLCSRDVKNYCDFIPNQLAGEHHRRLQKDFVLSCFWTAVRVGGTLTWSGCLQTAWFMLTNSYQPLCPKGWMELPDMLLLTPTAWLARSPGLKLVLQAR